MRSEHSVFFPPVRDTSDASTALHDAPRPPSRFDTDIAHIPAAEDKPLVAAIAAELWRLHGGNPVLNWIEAEILLANALAADQSFDAPDDSDDELYDGVE